MYNGSLSYAQFMRTQKIPRRSAHRNAKARFIVCTKQASRDLVIATGTKAKGGSPSLLENVI